MSLGIGFIIKKILSALLMPLTLGIVFAFIALFYLYRDKAKKARIYLAISMIWIALISFAPFANMLLVPLESSYPKLDKVPQNIKYILLLGGDRKKRTWEALRLYQQNKNLKIITSGFALYDTQSEAQKTVNLLLNSGVKKEDILIQGEAKDTVEEARAMKKRVGNKAFVLISSAYHLPRAMKIFTQEGLNPIPAPADFNNPDEESFVSCFQSKQLEKTEHAWHEYLGLSWLELKALATAFAN